MRKQREEYDIGAANQRESDWNWGYQDGRERREPRQPHNDDYMRGFAFGARRQS